MMANELKVKLKTLTPLWTGGVETGKMDRIHETGIIGSLRWWYEAIVRGLGGTACDPTEDKDAKTKRCKLDEKKYKESEDKPERKRLKDAGLCDVCQVFGATGWKRRFNLTSNLGERLFNDIKIYLPSGHVHNGRKGPRAGGWFLMGQSVLADDIELFFSPSDKKRADILRFLLSLIEQHAALGAKEASGYGVVEFKEQHKTATGNNWANIQIDLNSLSSIIPYKEQPRQNNLPDIRDFFFAKFQFKEPENQDNWWEQINCIQLALKDKITQNGRTAKINNPNNTKDLIKDFVKNKYLLPLAPDIRNWLRFVWESVLNDYQKNFIFGKIGRLCPKCYNSVEPHKYNNSKMWCKKCNMSKDIVIQSLSSKIDVSNAYKIDKNNNIWEFRIWGWLPCATLNSIGLDRNTFLLDLKKTLAEQKIWNWIFKSLVEVTCTSWHELPCNKKNGLNYLKKLFCSESEKNK